jgi:hypothetical protein
LPERCFDMATAPDEYLDDTLYWTSQWDGCQK